MVKIVPGFTEESVAKWKLALEDPEHELRLRVYFLAAQKRYARSLVKLERELDSSDPFSQLQNPADSGRRGHPEGTSPNQVGPAPFRCFSAIVLDRKRTFRRCELVYIIVKMALITDFGWWDQTIPALY